MVIEMKVVKALRMDKLSKRVKRKINIIGQRLRLTKKKSALKRWKKLGQEAQKKEFKGRKTQKQTPET